MAQVEEQRWQRRKAERPGEIIDAALELFVAKGFMGTRLDEVAKLAGVSKGTVYLYFDNKEALFKAVVETLVVPEIERTEQQIQAFDGSASELISQLVKQWWESVGESQLCGLPKLIIAEAGNFPELASFYVEHVIGRVRRVIARLISRGIAEGEFTACDPAYAARLLLAPMVFAAIYQHSLLAYDSEPFEVSAYLDNHLNIFLHGLVAPVGETGVTSA
jgi:AcrR family transcriptional regulator